MTDKNKKQNPFDAVASSWDDNLGRVKLAGNIGSAMLSDLSLTTEMEILDFGCGTGLISLKLAPAVKSIRAVDGSAGMIEILGQKLVQAGVENVTTLHLNIDNDPLPDGGFDAVVSSMVLHHVKDTDYLLGEFYRILKPGGRMAIADLETEDGSFHGNMPDVHHFGFDPETLKQQMETAGFSEVCFRVVHTVEKGDRAYPVFLITARK